MSKIIIESRRFCKFCLQPLSDFIREICIICEKILDEEANFRLNNSTQKLLLKVSNNPKEYLVLIIDNQSISITFYQTFPNFIDLKEVQFIFPELLNNYSNEITRFLSNYNFENVIIKNASKQATDWLQVILSRKIASTLKYLMISNSNLTILPPELTKISSLETLNLSKNKIRELPDSIGKLVNLTNLNLSENQITSLPETMAHLTKLKILDISVNEIRNIDSIFENIKLTRVKYRNNPLENVFIYNRDHLLQFKPKTYKKKKAIIDMVNSGKLKLTKKSFS